MGGTKSKDSTYYDPTLTADLIDENKQCKIYRNQQGEQFEKYRIKHKGNYDFDNRYEYRIKNSSPYLVDAYSAKSSQNAFGCASNDQYEVVTERIPFRLIDMTSLRGPEALNMANKSLRGFQQIFKSQGVLLVKDSMIGVNKQHKVKVWMNSNFALNEIEQLPISYGVLSEQEKESTMVDNIIELINSRAARDPMWVDFVEEKYRQGRIGFDQAIRLTEIEGSRHNFSLSNNFGTAIESRVSHVQGKVNQEVRNYPEYQIPSVKTPSMKNSTAVLNSEKFPPPNTNKTVASSLINLPSVVASTNIRPEIQNSLLVGNGRAQPTQGISGLKNRIVHGHPPSTRNQVAFSSNNNGYMPNNSFTSTLPRGLPSQSSSIDSSNKHFFNQPPAHSHLPQTPTPVLIRPTPSFADPQGLKPRAQSTGKPIVTFGNKVVVSSGINQYSNHISPAPILPMVAQTPRHEQLKTNQIQQFNWQPSIPNRQQPIILNQDKPVTALQLNEAPKYQVCPTEEKTMENLSEPKQIKVERILTEQASYPPPSKVVGFEKKIEIAQSKYLEDHTEAPSKDIQLSIQPIINENLEKSEHLPTQMDGSMNAKRQKNIQAEPYLEKKPSESDSVKLSRLNKSLTFGVVENANRSAEPSNQIFQTSKKAQKVEEDTKQTPFFGREIQINLNEGGAKNRELNQNEVDHILAYEEEQLKNIKKVQSSGIQIKHAESSQRDFPDLKQNISAGIAPKAQEMETVKENKSLTGSQREPEGARQNVVKDQTNFKKAVQESASNIRMETSKISIRNSSDLKGLISYKDLRDLLKTTRKSTK